MIRPEKIEALANAGLAGIREEAADADPAEVLSAVMTLTNWVVLAVLETKDVDHREHNRQIVRGALQKLLLHTADTERNPS